MGKKIFLLFFLIQPNTSSLNLNIINNTNNQIEVQILIPGWFCDRLLYTVDLALRYDCCNLIQNDFPLDIKIRIIIDDVPQYEEYYVRKNEKCKLVISNDRVYECRVF